MPPVAATAERFTAGCVQSCTAAGSDPAACERYCACALAEVEAGDLWAAIEGEDAAARDAAAEAVRRLCTAD